MVSRTCTDINGNDLEFHVRPSDMYVDCKEFIINRKSFSVSRWAILTAVLSVIVFIFKQHYADTRVLQTALVLLLLLFLLKLNFLVKQESLLVIASLGFQLQTTYITGRISTRFISRQDVEDLVINEAVRRHRVLHCLILLLKSADRTNTTNTTIVPLFEETLPRLDCLAEVYREVQYCIHAKC